MSTSTLETQTQETQNTKTETVQVSYQKHEIGLQTLAVDAFPVIEIGHPIEAKPQRKNRNWKAFLAALPVGGVFTVKDAKEAQGYYARAYMDGMRLSRKTQPGGLIRMQRTK